MKRIKLEVGDIFEVSLPNKMYTYFQYVGDDSTLMNSNVIRVFEYQKEENEKLVFDNILKSKILYYTHCMVKIGATKYNIWKKIGNVSLEINYNPPFFREHGDSGVKKSYTWYVWQVNNQTVRIGELTNEYINYNRGGVFHPLDVKEWIETGKNRFYLPE